MALIDCKFCKGKRTVSVILEGQNRATTVICSACDGTGKQSDGKK